MQRFELLVHASIVRAQIGARGLNFFYISKSAHGSKQNYPENNIVINKLIRVYQTMSRATTSVQTNESFTVIKSSDA